jgi:hypothetical protein
MTEQQRQQRAAFVRDQAALWLFLLYASAFFGCALAADALELWGGWTTTLSQRYMLPLVIALPLWFGLRAWAGRVRASSQDQGRA